MRKLRYEIQENGKINVGLPIILLLAVYMVWQLGVVYFSSTALVPIGRTPIPTTETATTLVLALGYVATIVFHLFFYRQTILFGKAAIALSFLATILLFLPLTENVLAVAFYVTAFCCTFLIGTTYSVEVSLFTSRSVLRSNLVGTAVGGALIALVQNDFVRLDFAAFTFISLILLAMLFIGYSMLPKSVDTLRVSVKRANAENKLPFRLLLGLYLSPFVSTLLLVFSVTVAETATHGVFIFYLCGAFIAAVWLFLCKRFKVSPFKISSVSFALSIVGFLFAALSIVERALIYPAIVLVSSNLAVANLIGFFANLAFEYRNTRFFGGGTLVFIGMAVALLQAGLLELLRDNLTLLFIVISVVSLVSAVLCILIEPSLSYRFSRRGSSSRSDSGGNIADKTAMGESNDVPQATSDALGNLNARDREIVELLLSGYTASEIARKMHYSEETIKTYKKNIYFTLDIHSKKELYILAKRRGAE